MELAANAEAHEEVALSSPMSISVVIPNFNHAAVLPRAIASILDQGDAVGELIIVDDGSTDDSVAVIEECIAHVPWARLLRHHANQGVAVALNTGLREARHDFVFLGAADDEYLPGTMRACLDMAQRHPQAALVCGDAVAVYEDGRRLAVSLPFGRNPRYVSPDELVGLARQQNLMIYSCSALLRREDALAAGGLMPQLRWHCDWHLNFVLAMRRGLCYVPRELAVVQMGQATYSRGRERWSEQREVLASLVIALQEQYSDVCPKMREAALLPIYEPAFLAVMLADRRLRGYLTLLLAWRLTTYKTLAMAARVVPWQLRQQLRAWLRV